MVLNNSCTNQFGKYMISHQSMFKPLTKKEERDMIDKNRSNPEKLRNLLINHNIRLVFNLARKYAKTSIDFDDLIARGFYGLTYAATKFDINRNIKFCTYATPWIFKYIVNEYFDKENKISRTGISLEKPIGKIDSKKAAFHNIVNNFMNPDYSPKSIVPVHESVCQNELSNIVSDISTYVETGTDFDDFDRIIYQKSLIDNISSTKISREINIPRKQVETKKKTLINKLRDHISKTYKFEISELFA